MLTVTIYSDMMADDVGVVEACWRAIEELRAVYGVTVFLEVLETSLLNIAGGREPVVVVGDTVIEVRGCNPRELTDKVVDAVLKAIAFKSKHEVLALELLHSTLTPKEFMEVA